MAKYDSDTTLLQRLKVNSDQAAANEIWHRYFDRLARLARRKLTQRQRRVSDEEDVALSAFNSLFRGIDAGRFPRLDDRNDLWQILVMLAERKSIDQKRKHLAKKRGGGEVRGDSAFSDRDSIAPGGFDQLPSDTPTDAEAQCFSETCLEMLGRLEDPELIQVALFKMEGYSNAMIASEIGRVSRSVERKLQTIRSIWSSENG